MNSADGRTAPDETHPIIPGEVTLAAARRMASTLLQAASGEEAALDARILLEEASGLDRAALLRHGDTLLGPAVAVRLGTLIRRRLAGEPVWRILGKREFWGLDFEITPAVLDPRPDTETVVRAALEASEPRRREPLRILDVGVGSGAILCALLRELPHALGWGVDRSEAACQVARRNAGLLGLGARALIVNGNWGEALLDRSFDLVVSNPPYIETAAIPMLAFEVRGFDPLPALDGGADGLGCYRAIAADLPRLLASDGSAILEVGAGQASAVQKVLTTAGLSVHSVQADLGGHDRAVVAALS